MAVALRCAQLIDNTNKRPVDVHFVLLTASNKKGVAELVGGELHVEDDVFWIELETTVNGKKVKRVIMKNQFAFRTNSNKRWQVANREAFNKRFSVS